MTENIYKTLKFCENEHGLKEILVDEVNMIIIKPPIFLPFFIKQPFKYSEDGKRIIALSTSDSKTYEIDADIINDEPAHKYISITSIN